jgi:ATP-dependent Clp protease ATP-binding subunit ClpA
MAERRSSKKRPGTETESSTAGISRRELLKAAGAATAGAVVAGSLASAAGAHDSQPTASVSDAPSPERSTWSRFTERARRVIFYAQEEAAQVGENFVGTEHLLLGLVREDNLGSGVLVYLGISRDSLRQAIMDRIVRGPGNLGQDMQLTPRAKLVIDLTEAEAQALGHDYIGCEHLLLGLLREGEGLAAQVLGDLGVDSESVRREIPVVGAKWVEVLDAERHFRETATPAACLHLQEALTAYHTFLAGA